MRFGSRHGLVRQRFPVQGGIEDILDAPVMHVAEMKGAGTGGFKAALADTFRQSKMA